MCDDLKELKNFAFYLAKNKKRKQRKKAKQFQRTSYLKTATRVKSFFFSHARAYRIHNFFLFGHGFNVSWPLHFEIHFAGQELTYILVMKQIHMTLERVGIKTLCFKKSLLLLFQTVQHSSNFSRIFSQRYFLLENTLYLSKCGVFLLKGLF